MMRTSVVLLIVGGLIVGVAGRSFAGHPQHGRTVHKLGGKNIIDTFVPCTAPNDTTVAWLGGGFPACHPAALTPGCHLGPAAHGFIKIVEAPPELDFTSIVRTNGSMNPGCAGATLKLFMKVRVTADDCASGDALGCTTFDIPIPLGSCVIPAVAPFQCAIGPVRVDGGAGIVVVPGVGAQWEVLDIYLEDAAFPGTAVMRAGAEIQ